MEIFPGDLAYLDDGESVRVELLPVATRDGVHAAPPRRPPWYQRKRRRWWDQNVRGLIETSPRFRLRITRSDGQLIIDVDDYTLYLILCFGKDWVIRRPHTFD